MTTEQCLRRLSQKSNNGWHSSINSLNFQLSLIKKLYRKNGLDLIMTCSACPEQYDVFKDGIQVAYYRLRHGEFRVDYKECGGETIYETQVNGDGIFDDNERLYNLTKAMRAVLNKMIP